MRLSGMETFSLVVWLMMGQRYEQTEIENLHRAECKRVMALFSERPGSGTAQCVMEERDGYEQVSRRRNHRRP